MPDEIKGRESARRPAPAAPAVLVIDDDPAVLDSLATLFEIHGISIATAQDGVAGLEAFRRTSPAVVLTDIIMPEQDGIGVILQMRRERPGVKIIAMSGGGRIGKSDLLAIAKQLGADSVIQKPFDVSELMATVRGHLELPGRLPSAIR
jgi:DNA-binding response OmpR family regulator